MFCPACGVTNEEAARFCNQCGARIASMQPVSSTQQGALAPPPSPVEAPVPQRIPTGMGTTGDRISLPMVGPSRRTLVLAGSGIGVACLALGALVAWQTIPRAPTTPPPTTVGLVGDPTEVTPTVMTDAGISEPAPRTTGRTGRGNTAARANPTGASPSRAPAATPSRVAANAHTTPNPGTAANPGASPETPTTVAQATPSRPATAATPSRAASGSAALPVDSQGVIEHGPQQTVAGFRQGDETDATGTMDPHVFRFVYDHYKSQIASCYSSATRAHEISGVIVVRVRIGEDGHVARTRVISDNTNAPGLASCVQTAIRGWRYPQPEGGEVEVDYPMRMGSGLQL